MRILLTKGTPSAPKSQPRFIHIHKSLGKSCLCSLEPARGTERKKHTETKTEKGERDVRKAEEQTYRKRHFLQHNTALAADSYHAHS